MLEDYVVLYKRKCHALDIDYSQPPTKEDYTKLNE